MILKRKLGIKDILNILNTKRNVKTITCSRGTYNHLPKKALRALNKMNIRIKIVNLKRGLKPKADIKKIKRFSYLSAIEISKRTHIPLRTVYYHLKKLGIKRIKKKQ